MHALTFSNLKTQPFMVAFFLSGQPKLFVSIGAAHRLSNKHTGWWFSPSSLTRAGNRNYSGETSHVSQYQAFADAKRYGLYAVSATSALFS
jgi:hypothetical protein